LNHLADEELMRRFQEGDRLAFEVLLRRHRAGVFRFVHRFVGDRHRAEDLCQETWLEVIRSARRYRPEARFVPWLFTIARNECRDGARREALRKTASLDRPAGEDGRAIGESIADGVSPSPERAAHASRMGPVLERAIAALPVEQREVFLLREGAGVPFAEIAAIAGVPVPTVKSRMRYALGGLRRALDAAGLDGDLGDETPLAGGGGVP
jgi:RNA polymerase sigma-70 factor (ECF subfamily)